ncbi:MAG: acetyl-CoA carboxylase biotin carboxylase subunit [Candidatus Omnitrophica bacterium]|nr:acetyl-CoA carboxylase biotin carboxylase subunit [Candidatus Omnitrophota bacterium]
MFNKILIANRGEVAVRIIRACRELGIRTVAVFSKADRESLHVRLADQAICVGDSASQESYLNIPAIISAAEITDVEAIHPGYGFLAENSHFAEVCQSCQITFIGPRPEAIRLMGDKAEALKLMKKNGIPTVPGSDGIIKDSDEALKVARRVKYPVIVKAAGGGGGKGMRTAHNDGHLVSAFMTAQAEAEKAFSNPAVYIEKYIEEPRHVEVQILADNYGATVHLGERDCTIQRNHQKLIEEAPSPILGGKLRRRIGEVALKCARLAHYNNAGTIEFLVDKDRNFYFMEMNTRIQVEHPVTELVTGIDIVKEQIRIASGERLRFRQENIRFHGWAIECRINAEDPDKGFTPSPGYIKTYRPPGGPRVRLDTHIYPNYLVPPFYDSMIAKLIVHGNDRQEAINIMKRALDEFEIGPVKTTIPLHQKIFRNPAFLRGQVSTHFIETFFSNGNKI